MTDRYIDPQRDEMLIKFAEYLNTDPNLTAEEQIITLDSFWEWNTPTDIQGIAVPDMELYIKVVTNVDPFHDEGGPCNLIGIFSFYPEEEPSMGALEMLLHQFDGILIPIYGYIGYAGNLFNFGHFFPREGD